jgi:hypothetical protein
MLDDVAVISRHNEAAEKTRRIYWDFEPFLQLLTISGLWPLCHQLPDENDRGTGQCNIPKHRGGFVTIDPTQAMAPNRFYAIMVVTMMLESSQVYTRV